jgi:dTDP-D-glucose 4,6-dehydratase
MLVFTLAAAYGDDDAASCSADDRDVYLQSVSQRISAYWHVPEHFHSVRCVVVVAQNFRGEVLNVGIEECRDNAELEKTLEDAVYEASPLPMPANRDCFERKLRLNMVRKPD